MLAIRLTTWEFSSVNPIKFKTLKNLTKQATKAAVLDSQAG
jgi:hypothetical protein